MGLPLLGSALDLKRDLLGTLHRAMLEHGDVVRFSAGPSGKHQVNAYGFFHPDGAQHLLAGNADNYEKNDPVYQEIRSVLGDGLLTAEGDEWKRQKRLVQPIFTHKRVASYVPMIAGETADALRRWSEAARRGDKVDLNSDMARLTLSVVGRALFGADVESAVPVIRRAVPYLSERAVQRGLSPVVVPAAWPTPSNRRALRYQRDLYKVVDQLIADRRASPAGGEDLLGLLLQARDPEGGMGLTDAEVRDQVLIFLLAGHETTATSLTFTFHLLGHHPKVQARVQEEVDCVLGDGPPSLGDVKALSYTTMAIKEAMRLYPAAYGMGRLAKRDDVVGGYHIPAGSPAFASAWVTHRHPDFWPYPERFDPARFTPEREKARHRYAYFPFGGGPRACIGQYFSMLEAVIVVAMLMRSHRVTTSSDPVKLFTGITLRPDGPMPATVEARR
jgi:cytochrome P450